MMAAMLIFVRILANAAVEYDIRQSLDREAFKNLKEIAATPSGELILKENFVQKEGDIYFLVLNKNGDVISGEYPQGCPQDIEINLKKLQRVSKGLENYFIRDMRKHLENGRRFYLRAIVRKSDAYSRYQTMEYLAYFSLFVVSGIVILWGLLLAKRIAGSLREMCRSAETIGQNMNMSRRMEYDGKFYELAVLTQANNRMLDRLE